MSDIYDDPKESKEHRKFIHSFRHTYECECFTNGKPTRVLESAKHCKKCGRINIAEAVNHFSMSRKKKED